MFDRELSHVHHHNLFRQTITADPVDGAHVLIDGKPFLLLCSNDYLGLARHPALRQAATEAMERYGFGSGASRLISGTSTLHHELEQEIARFKGTEAALVFNSGYAANTGIIPAIVGEEDRVLCDRLNHASIIDGCRLSRAKLLVYRHKDVGQVETLLKKDRKSRRTLIVTDGVFSMDGDIAPLPELASLAEQYGAMLMVDDAHGTGVLGKTGRGTVEHFGLSGRVHIQMGTLGKAFGSYGAYAAGPSGLISLLVNRARSFIYSTALPPAVCAASLAALRIIEKEPERRARLWDIRARFVDGLQRFGINPNTSETPIVPLLIGPSEKALRASQALYRLGVHVAAIRPPSVPDGSARLRATVTAAHSEKDIDQALEAFNSIKQEGLL